MPAIPAGELPRYSGQLRPADCWFNNAPAAGSSLVRKCAKQDPKAPAGPRVPDSTSTGVQGSWGFDTAAAGRSRARSLRNANVEQFCTSDASGVGAKTHQLTAGAPSLPGKNVSSPGGAHIGQRSKKALRKQLPAAGPPSNPWSDSRPRTYRSPTSQGRHGPPGIRLRTAFGEGRQAGRTGSCVPPK